MKRILALLFWFVTQAAWAQQRRLATEKTLQEKITVTQTAVFDTIAAYAEGKVLNYQTHMPVVGASISIVYNGGRAMGAAVTDKEGQFRVGWVSTGKDRSIRVKAAGFQLLERREARIRDGYSNFLLIELLPVAH